MASVPKRKYTAEEYLALEATREDRHAFFAGEIFATSGGSRAHNLITLNLAGLLRNAVRGGNCRVYAMDLRVKAEASGLYTYPDLVVACGHEEVEGETLLNPRMIVEVLSKSTESYDRGKKFERYREIPSLREYLLVSQHEPHVDGFVLGPANVWTVKEPVRGLDAILELTELGCRLPLKEIYEDVVFSPDE